MRFGPAQGAALKITPSSNLKAPRGEPQGGKSRFLQIKIYQQKKYSRQKPSTKR